MNRYLLTLLAMNAIALAASGSAAEPLKTDSAALATLRQSNARLSRFVLDNGMTCLVKPDHSAPVVAIQIWVGSGSIHEGDLLGAGLSHYVEHMIFKGTPTRKPGDIAKALYDLGGDINAYTGLDRTVFHADLPSRNWREALSILADAVMHASFPEEEWRKEKDVVLREFSMGRDNPDRQISELLWRTAYALHPYRVPVIGYREVFQAVTRDDLVTFFHRRYVPDNMIAVVVGAIEPREVEQALREVFAPFVRRPNPAVVLPEEPRQTAPRTARETGPYQVSRLAVAFHTVALPHKDAPALEVLAAIMGGGQSSRLVQSIKEDRQLVHSISASSFTPRYPGMFIVDATLDPTNEDAAVQAILKEIDAWPSAKFPAPELAKAKRMMLVSELSSLQSMNGQAASYASSELFAQDPRFGETYLDQIERVTPADLQAVARMYFTPENRSIVVLAPATATNAAAPAVDQDRPADVTRHTTQDGLTFIVREDRRLPFVYVCAAFLGGVLSETETNSGVTQLMSDLLIRGTTSRSARDIASTIESLGASLTPFSGYNSFGLQGRCLAHDIDTLTDVMADCLAHASFPADEVAKQKTVQLASIDAQQERPMFIAQQALGDVLFAGHPYRWNALGQRAAVEKIDRAALQQHYQRHVVSGNLVLAIFGDIDATQAGAITSRLGHALRHAVAPARTATAAAQPVLPARVESRKQNEQCIVLLGFPGVSLHDPRRDALQVLEAAMSGMSSRLFHTIREERGLAYFTGTNQRIGVDPGQFTLYAGTRLEARAEVEALLLQEVGRVTQQGLEADEIARAKTQLIADAEMRLQDNMSLATACALNELYGLGCNHDFTTRQRIEAVTPGQIREAAIATLQTNRMAVSVVIPEKAAEPRQK